MIAFMIQRPLGDGQIDVEIILNRYRRENLSIFFLINPHKIFVIAIELLSSRRFPYIVLFFWRFFGDW